MRLMLGILLDRRHIERLPHLQIRVPTAILTATGRLLDPLREQRLRGRMDGLRIRLHKRSRNYDPVRIPLRGEGSVMQEGYRKL